MSLGSDRPSNQGATANQLTKFGRLPKIGDRQAPHLLDFLGGAVGICRASDLLLARRMIFITIYAVFSITLAVSAWANAVASGLSLLTIALIAFCSGAGLRGSFYYGYQQISAATMATLTCMAIATWIGQGFTAQLFGIELSGSVWGWLGFIVAFIVNPGHCGRWTALKSI
jgi:hypothetical protein